MKDVTFVKFRLIHGIGELIGQYVIIAQANTKFLNYLSVRQTISLKQKKNTLNNNNTKNNKL